MRPLWIAGLVLLVAGTGPAAACTCFFDGPFSKVASEGDLVVLGEVVSHHGNSMQLDVLQVLKGVEKRQRITVWGDNGMQCRPYLSQFPDKTKWVLSVYQLPEKAAQDDLARLREPLPESAAGSPFYGLSGCGIYWLQVDGEDAHGQINEEEYPAESEEVIPLHELVRWFEQGAKGPLSPMSRPSPAD